jgi:hypothetical protein
VILEFVSNLLAGLITLAVNLLPQSSWAPDASGMNDIIGYVKGLNADFPVELCVTLFAIWVFFVNGTLLFDVALWVYRKIPMVGGSE